MIIRGGENIYPKEIEEFIYTCPKVSDVQVIGVPDEKYGEEIMACIILKDGEEMTVEEMKTYIRAEHTALERHELQVGERLYDKFGEWKAANPNHPIAKKNYPAGEYVQVIAAFRKYFDEQQAAANVVELDI
jgi:hypothetical protein